MPKKINSALLFTTTVRLFAEHGYGACTTQAIAAAAGVGEVTIFRRYGNKAGLIEAALAHCLPRTPFGNLTASDDVQADLTAILRAYAQTFGEYGGAVITLLTEAPRHPELGAALATLMPNMMQGAAIIASHQAAGRIGAGDPLQKLVILIAPIMAAGLFGRIENAPETVVLAPEMLTEMFLRGHG